MTSFQNGDNFIRNMVTISTGGGGGSCQQPTMRKVATSDGLSMTVDQVCDFLKLDAPDDELATVELMMRGAAAFLEKRTALVLIPSTYELTLSSWWLGAMEVRRGPLRAIEAVRYLRGRDDWVTVDGEDYWEQAGPAEFTLRTLDTFDRPTTWQNQDCIQVRFSAGFDTVDESGQSEGSHPLEDGMKLTWAMLTGHYYANRELFMAGKLEQVEMGAGSLLGAYRAFW